MTSTLHQAAHSRAELRARIATAIATREGYPAPLPIHEHLGSMALDAVEEVMTDQAAELARLHASWMLQHEQLDYARRERDYAFDQLGRVSADQADPVDAVTTEWTVSDPEPEASVRAVRGRRTRRIYFRESDNPGGRWVHRQTGAWLTWPALLRYEQTAHQFHLEPAR